MLNISFFFSRKSFRIIIYFLVLLIISSHRNFAQIKIEEEAILKNNNPYETQSITMPFYGRVYGEMNPNAVQLHGLVLVTIEAGGQSINIGPNCTNNQFVNSWSIDGVPQDAFVSVTVYDGCDESTPMVANSWFESRGENMYAVYYYHNSVFQHVQATTLNLVEQMACSGLPNCDGYDLPELYFKKIESSTYSIPENKILEVVEACTTNTVNRQVAGMKMAPWHLPENILWELYPCADPVEGNVRFPFKFKIDGVWQNKIPFVYLVGMCDTTGSNRTYITSLDDLKAKINNRDIPENDWCTVLNDICGHFGDQDIRTGKVILEEMVMFHENMHFDDYYLKYYEENLPELINDLRSLNLSCTDYINDPEIAKNEAKERIINLLKNYQSRIEGKISAYGRDKIDGEINSSSKIYNTLKPYYTWMKSRTRPPLWNYICGETTLCTNFKNATF